MCSCSEVRLRTLDSGILSDFGSSLGLGRAGTVLLATISRSQAEVEGLEKALGVAVVLEPAALDA